MAKSKKSGKTKKVVKTPPVRAVPAPVEEIEAVQALAPRQQSSGPMARLRTLNTWLAALFGAQGLAVLVAAATHSWPVTTNYLASDPIASQIAGHTVMGGATKHLFDVNVAILVAALLFIAALAHLLVATKYRATYESQLQRGLNKMRWVEYGLAGGVMLLILGLLGGVSDISSLLMLFVLSLVAAGVSLSAELHLGRARRTLCALAGLVGLVPWAVFGIYVWGAQSSGGHIPAFLWVLYVTMFAAWVASMFNLRMIGKQRGRWASYLYGERVFMVLSLVAYTALAWQVFTGALRP
jgi:Heliorhodopsin